MINGTPTAVLVGIKALRGLFFSPCWMQIHIDTESEICGTMKLSVSASTT